MAVDPLSLLALLALGPPESPAGGWLAPDGCPTRAEVQTVIDTLLLEPPAEFEPWSGTLEPSEEGYQLTLDVGVRHRVVSAPDCDSLGIAAALIVAVAHDPLSVAAGLEPPVQRPAAAPPSAKPASTVREEEDAPDDEGEDVEADSDFGRPERIETGPPRRDGTGLQGLARLSFGVDVGALPSPGIGFEVATGIRGKHWRAELGAVGFVPRRIAMREREEFGATATILGGQVRGCYDFTRPRLDVPVCAGFEAASVSAEGFGPGVSGQDQNQLWLAALASGGVAWWARPRFGLAARGELVVALRQPAVHIDGVGFVFRAGSVGARLWLGPVLRFP